MKKHFKRLSCMILTFVMILVMTPLGVSAATPRYDKQQIFYLSGEGTGDGYNGLRIDNLSSSDRIAKSSVKVSGSAIRLESLSRNISSSQTDSFVKSSKSYKSSNNFYYIYYDVKKAGQSKISFKVGNKTYTSTVKVLPYTNPLSKLTITGVNGNLASKFKKGSISNVKITKTLKNAKIQCTAAKDWKITRINYNDSVKKLSRNISSQNGSGVSTLSISVGNITAKSSNTLDILFYNTRTKGYAPCFITCDILPPLKSYDFEVGASCSIAL